MTFTYITRKYSHGSQVTLAYDEWEASLAITSQRFKVLICDTVCIC